MSKIVVHMLSLPDELAPTKAKKHRAWWQTDTKTKNHALHCLPLTMANSLGYYILAPGDFTVSWDGSWDRDAEIDRTSLAAEGVVDNHSAHGAFTVQPGFIPVTDQVGDFIFIKGTPNYRGSWFTVLEALIEAWWQPAEFGIVCMMSRPGTFTVCRGDPIAQMFVYKADGAFASLTTSRIPPPETDEWRQRRSRPNYRKDFDYLLGRHPDGTPELTHLRTWKQGQ